MMMGKKGAGKGGKKDMAVVMVVKKPMGGKGKGSGKKK